MNTFVCVFAAVGLIGSVVGTLVFIATTLERLSDLERKVDKR